MTLRRSFARLHLRLYGCWVNVRGLQAGPWVTAGADVELVDDGRGGYSWSPTK